MTKEDFLKIDISKISQVYHGKRDCCRCGCGGEYIATSYMYQPRSAKVNDKLVQEHLDWAKHMLTIENANFDAGETWFDVEIGRDKSLTFYFDELK